MSELREGYCDICLQLKPDLDCGPEACVCTECLSKPVVPWTIEEMRESFKSFQTDTKCFHHCSKCGLDGYSYESSPKVEKVPTGEESNE